MHGAGMGGYITVELKCFVDTGLAAATRYTVSMYDLLLQVDWLRAGLVVILKKHFVQE